MKPVLVVFIDGLKPESIKYMPFLNSFKSKRRIRTELGYSPTCYASMFTGVYPNKHLHWFTWKYSPSTSPYKWLRRFNIDKLPHNLLTKYLCYKISDLLAHGIIPWQGVMSFSWWYSPIQNWHLFDIVVKKPWFEPNFVENYPTIFDTLKAKNIHYQLVGIEGNLERSSKTIKQFELDEVKPLTFFFIGDIDPITHRHGQTSDIVIERLREIDTILKEKYDLFEKRLGDFNFMLFSDHGHVRVSDTMDLKSVFNSYGDSLDNYIYLIDANFARFWFRDRKEEQKVREILYRLEDKGLGFILTEKHLQKYHVNMPDNRYGDLIFYLDAPFFFTMPPSKIFGKKLDGKRKHVSMHGYLPDNPDSDGIFISNNSMLDCSHIQLVDIVPSLLDLFDIEIPSYMDGRVLWK